MKRKELIGWLEGKFFHNCKGDELHILLGGYDTKYGHVRLTSLCTYHLREIAKAAFKK
jgi:hypothetical protein